MDKATEIVKTANISDLTYYIEYIEILIEIMKKRDNDIKDLQEEHLILTNRYKELIIMKKKKTV